MDAVTRIERSLTDAINLCTAPETPPRLAAAMRHAVFPRGARVRPRLCLAVAAACGDSDPTLTDAAAAAIELLHCASLVHDDLPCFDDAALRRGRKSVHRAFGEPIALLAGDAMIVLAFEILARKGAPSPARLPPLLLIIAQAVGVPAGIAAGQAWECEPRVDLACYQRAKTGALFAAATMAGAASVGRDGESWRGLGLAIGEAYQIADDIRDLVGNEIELGKPVGQDAAHHRPNAAAELGLAGAVARLRSLTEEAIAIIPPCPGAADLAAIIQSEARRLVPRDLARQAA
ncbi:MAG: polyprenyl synthetase family protein [Acidibrevibacterium sp.]|jgi:geranylgeranyl diphosphate synthase type II|uniref:polyprenyl synthetase family protein n=1 Tax=Acidibrevibacterium fodinaquatile TaxID=1969806 RepID=UPI0023A7C89F|nr:polyprenyl synthetase family protein [Acidibrevibacterium fodinaquatile]MCA7120683.1 polyprenyl synthetase family protein [Acidibrevibacterium fodinaquatile]